jgi:hypothetical protein
LFASSRRAATLRRAGAVTFRSAEDAETPGVCVRLKTGASMLPSNREPCVWAISGPVELRIKLTPGAPRAEGGGYVLVWKVEHHFARSSLCRPTGLASRLSGAYMRRVVRWVANGGSKRSRRWRTGAMSTSSTTRATRVGASRWQGTSGRRAGTPRSRRPVEQGRKLAQRNKSELVIHKQDGKIGDRRSYGNDPFPPRG